MANSQDFFNSRNCQFTFVNLELRALSWTMFDPWQFLSILMTVGLGVPNARCNHKWSQTFALHFFRRFFHLIKQQKLKVTLVLQTNIRRQVNGILTLQKWCLSSNLLWNCFVWTGPKINQLELVKEFLHKKVLFFYYCMSLNTPGIIQYYYYFTVGVL